MNRIYTKVFHFFLFIFFLPSTGRTDPIITLSTDKNGMHVVKNSHLGIILASESALKKFNYSISPIQAFIYPDKQASDISLNFLQSETKPISAKVKITRSEKSINYYITYLFNKPKFPGNFALSAAGRGFYSCSVTVTNNSKTIIIEEDSDYDVSYQIDISKGLNPDQGRYRGWNSTSPESGYEPDRKIYRDENKRSPLDATIDFKFENFSIYPFLSNWDPAGGGSEYWKVLAIV